MSIISQHPHLGRTRRRIAHWFVWVVLLLSVVACVGLVVGGLWFGFPLMIIMAFLVVGLDVPLVMLTSLHPDIDVHEQGLMVTPLMGKARLVSWEDLRYISPHSLLKPHPPERATSSRTVQQEGLLVVAKPGALAWHFRLVGVFTGHGWQPTFGATNTTHTDYNQLRFQLKKVLPLKEPE